jgi:hypothetical protein
VDEMIGEEIKTLITILRHQALVATYLRKLATRIMLRAGEHDLSKLGVGQFTEFIKINRIAREHKYGSPEYKASIDTDVIERHFRCNSHHPEHHENGVNDMGLADFIEMILDWKAAAEVYGKTTMEEGLVIQTERFELDERHLYLIDLIYRELEELPR